MKSLQGPINITDTGGSTLLDPQVTTLSGVTVALDGSDAQVASSWTSLTGGTLQVTGGSVTLPGLTDVDGSNLQASSGGKLTLLGLKSYQSNYSTFQADGAGSVLDVSALATVNPSGAWYVDASNGGEVNLSGLNSLQGNIAITDTGGSTLLDPQVTTLSGVTVALDGSDAQVASSWTSLTGGTLQVTGGSVTLPGLTDVDGSNLQASSGGKLTLLGLKSYQSNYSTFQADGAGSVLDVSALATVNPSGAWYVDASNGGEVNLSGLNSLQGNIAISDTGGSTLLDPQVTTLSGVTVTLDGSDAQVANSWTSLTGGTLRVTGGSVTLPGLTDVDGSNLQASSGGKLTLLGLNSYKSDYSTFQADGAGSVLDVSALATVNPSGAWYVDASNGGEVNLSGLNSLQGNIAITDTGGSTLLDPQVTTLSGVTVTLDGSDAQVASSWTSLTGGTLHVTGGSVTLPGLTDVDGSNLYALRGGKLTLLGLNSYQSNYSTFQADGASSVLDVSALTTFSQSGPWAVDAINGGEVNLSGMKSLLGPINITETGGGTLLDPNVTTFANVTITTDPTGTFSVPANQTFSFPFGATSINTGTVLDQGAMDLGSASGNATVNVQGGLTINGQGALSVSSSSTVEASGNLLGDTTNAAGFDPLGTVVLDSGGGTNNPPQLVEVMSQDLGNVAAGFNDNFAYSTLQLTANTYVQLVDNAANSPGNAPEALYVNDLIVPAGATLNLDGLHLYVQTEQINGTVITGGAVVSGEVYNDVNGNGTLDNGEPGLAGWTVDLTNTATNSSYTTTTSAGGLFSLTGIAGGTYTLSEVPQPGFDLTQPASPGTYTITVASGQTVSGEDFGNHPTAAVGGVVFNDLNGDGTLENGEPGLSGWTVNLLSGSSQVIASATTGSAGNYSFTSLLPATYMVQVVAQSGYVASSAASVAIADGNGQAEHGQLRRVRAGHDQRRAIRRPQ